MPKLTVIRANSEVASIDITEGVGSCELCNEEFQNLRRHFRRGHKCSTDPTRECPVCKEKVLLNIYTVHLKLHEIPAKCSECPRICRSMNLVDIHIKKCHSHVEGAKAMPISQEKSKEFLQRRAVAAEMRSNKKKGKITLKKLTNLSKEYEALLHTDEHPLQVRAEDLFREFTSMFTISDTDVLARHSSYVSVWNENLKIPYLVFEKIENDPGLPVFSSFHFIASPGISKSSQPLRSEYEYTGWQRGHAAAAANYHSEHLVTPTYYYTNILPMTLSMNISKANLERHLRETANENGSVYAWHFPTRMEDGHRYVGTVAIPPAVATVMLVKTENGPKIYGWELPQSDVMYGYKKYLCDPLILMEQNRIHFRMEEPSFSHVSSKIEPRMDDSNFEATPQTLKNSMKSIPFSQPHPTHFHETAVMNDVNIIDLTLLPTARKRFLIEGLLEKARKDRCPYLNSEGIIQPLRRSCGGSIATLPFKCGICSLDFQGRMRRYLEHLEGHYQTMDQQCEFPGCGRWFNDNLAMKSHMATNHAPTKTRFKCATCCKVYVSGYYCRLHQVRDGCVIGKLVRIKIDSKSGLETQKVPEQQHAKKNCQPKVYPCTFRGCKKSYTSKHSLQSHAQINHSSTIIRYKCAECMKNYSSKKNCFDHQRRKSCNVGKVVEIKVNSKSRPEIQMDPDNEQVETHCQPKVYPCKISGCKKSFNNDSSLKTHWQLKHSPKIFRYKCITCSKNYARKEDCIKHQDRVGCDVGKVVIIKVDRKSRLEILIDSDNQEGATRCHPKVFPCKFPGCKKSYDDNLSLKRHWRLKHSPTIFRYKCITCSKNFALKNDCIKHQDRIGCEVGKVIKIKVDRKSRLEIVEKNPNRNEDDVISTLCNSSDTADGMDMD